MIEPWILAIIVKPFALAVLFLVIVWPIERAISRLLPEGRLKRILFFSWRV